MGEYFIRERGLRVSPKSRKEIKLVAEQARSLFGLSNTPYVDLALLMEDFIQKDIVEILDDDDFRLKGKYACTSPDEFKIYLRESVYNTAHDGDERSRFTIAHELGHLIMHKGQQLFARNTNVDHKVYEDSEWQADTFASYFLINSNFVSDGMGSVEINELFGVSKAAAETWLSKNRK